MNFLGQTTKTVTQFGYDVQGQVVAEERQIRRDPHIGIESSSNEIQPREPEIDSNLLYFNNEGNQENQFQQANSECSTHFGSDPLSSARKANQAAVDSGLVP
jgi:hypothetical protein